jgi:DNA-binding NtrC family response regulator
MSVNTGDGETSVYLYLPIVSAVVDEEVESRPAGIHPEGAAVAVIDGDAMMRDLLDEVLSQKGFAVRSYANPASARAAGADADSRLVFVDVSSRTPEGREFIEELKKKDTSIVAIVGEAMGAEDLKSIRKDLAGCLQKPFGLDEINELCRVVAPEQAQREEVAVGVSR